jgi:radical SAM superfamily enzyme YgiQ (UPF0313 family)
VHYEGVIIRPPSEAHSLLIQVTTGCSHNKCTFCGTYKWNKKFGIKDFDTIRADIDEAAPYGPFPRVFLPDGDALIMPMRKLVPVLEYLNEKLDGLERIGVYGNAKSILRKTPEELEELRKLKLDIVYMGVETGNRELLARVKKGVSYEQMVEAGRKAIDAGLTLSVTVLLGLGGVEASQLHARDTARILTEIDPQYVGALTLMLIPGTPIAEDAGAGKFQMPDEFGFLEELGTIIGNSDLTHCFFASNHASNYLPIKGWLPEEKERLLGIINRVLESRDPKMLKPEYLRAL